MRITRRTFIKASFITGALLISGSGLKAVEIYGSSAKEDSTGPLPGIDVGGIIRPPGALPEKEFRAKCISCGVCVNVCHVMKYDAIAIAGLKDIKNFGTPL